MKTRTATMLPRTSHARCGKLRDAPTQRSISRRWRYDREDPLVGAHVLDDGRKGLVLGYDPQGRNEHSREGDPWVPIYYVVFDGEEHVELDQGDCFDAKMAYDEAEKGSSG